MAYNDFTIDALIEKFDLTIRDDAAFFASFPPLPISDLLKRTLDENIPVALHFSTEKARSELLIMPVLMEVRRQLSRRISVFSGVPFNVASDEGLMGVCDFLLSLSPVQLVVQAPVVSVVEAKNDNIRAGIAQCIAEMIAAEKFNAAKENLIESVFGVVTTGTIWQFFRLTGKVVSIDDAEYPIGEPERIVGILTGMIQSVASDQPRPTST